MIKLPLTYALMTAASIAVPRSPVQAAPVSEPVREPASEPVLERMPATLETRFALSALPRPMRARAAVYLLDPATGYHLSQDGTSGVTCLVQRTAWENADYRSDIYVPRCYDAAGARTYLKVLMDAAALRAGGMGPTALKTEIAGRYRSGRYTVPAKAGLSYMIAPVMRTWVSDTAVRTLSGPHVMFYAPTVTSADLGAMPDSLPRYPFALQEGIPEQSYILQMLGETERSKVMTDERELLDALCAYRSTLCLTAPAAVATPTASRAPVAGAHQPRPVRDGAHDFDFEIGTWKTHLTRRLRPLTGSTTWVEYDGTTVVRKVWDGRASLVELVADGPAGHFQGLNLRLYNPATHQWTLNFANGADGMLTQPTVGEFRDGRGEFYDQETLNGRSILVRFVISNITPTSCRFEQSFSDDGGKTWELNWVAVDTRVADATH